MRGPNKFSPQRGVPLCSCRSCERLPASLTRASSFFRRGRAGSRRALPRHPFGMARQRLSRSGSATLAFECALHGARTPAGRFSPSRFAAFGEIALGLAFGSRLAALGRWQLHSGPARLRQTDRDRLLRRARAMFALADVLHLLAHKLPCLRRRRQPLPFVFACPFNCFVFWHNKIVSLGTSALDVNQIA
jgi:hypothetical protein